MFAEHLGGEFRGDYRPIGATKTACLCVILPPETLALDVARAVVSFGLPAFLLAPHGFGVVIYWLE
jgi:hypothetical protein